MSDTKSTLALTLAEADLERIIADTIKAQVAATFAARGGQLAGTVIERLLTEKVDGDGKPCHYSKTTMIEQLCYGELRRIVKEQVVLWVKENEPEIRKTVAAQLTKNKSKLAGALLASLVQAAADQYRFGISINVGNPPKED
jgi:dsRNA-specific ribonuclease